MTTGEKILMLCKESHVRQKDLAESIGYTESAMTKWIKGSRMPNADAIVRIAEYFGVSADYLLGLSEHRSYVGFVSCDELMEYCDKAAEISLSLRGKALADNDEVSSHTLAMRCQASAYFESQYVLWKFDVQNAIHSVADGSWRIEDD